MLTFIVCAVLVAADQITKYLAAVRLKGLESTAVIKGFFSLTYVENRGAAFGMMNGARWLFIAVTAAVVAVAVTYLVKTANQKGNRFMRSCVIMIISGAIGNVIDRAVRGYVVDFLDFNILGYDFPVFNVADILVVCGTLLLCACVLMSDKTEKKEK